MGRPPGRAGAPGRGVWLETGADAEAGVGAFGVGRCPGLPGLGAAPGLGAPGDAAGLAGPGRASGADEPTVGADEREAFEAGAALAEESPPALSDLTFSVTLRTTGASMVDEADRTNSPMSFSFARSSLLSSPSSLASS